MTAIQVSSTTDMKDSELENSRSTPTNVSSNDTKNVFRVLAKGRNFMLQTGIYYLGVGNNSVGLTLERFFQKTITPPKEEFVVNILCGQRMIIPPRPYQAGLLSIGEYEKETTEVWQRLIERGMNVVDVGAHLGYYTLLAAKLATHGKVYAFEPDPIYSNYLRRNIALNEHTNVIVNQMAVADENKTSNFYSDTSGGEGSLIPQAKSNLQTEVTTTSLDSYFESQNWPNVDLMKIDIEGMEINALLGMQKLVKRNPQLKLVIEFAAFAPDNLLSQIFDCGFCKVSIIEQDMKVVTNPNQVALLRRRSQGNRVNLLCEQE